MNTTRSSIIVPKVRGYADLQREMHRALRAQHPEWVEADGKSPTCDYYESLFAQLLVSYREHARVHFDDLLSISRTDHRYANSSIPDGGASWRPKIVRSNGSPNPKFVIDVIRAAAKSAGKS